MATPDELRDGLLELERRVHDAAARLHELRELNRDLKRQVRELEEPLAVGGGTERAAWQAERADVRQRLQTLTQRLEKLLDI